MPDTRSFEAVRQQSPQAQLLALRDVFLRTGAVHELQRMNLWVWAELTAPHLEASQVEIKPESFEVVFDYEPNRKVLKLFRMRPPKDFQGRLEGLNEAVQMMFGADYAASVKCAGQLIFSGSRRSAPVARPEYRGVDYEAGRLVPSKPWVFKKPSPSPPSKTP